MRFLFLMILLTPLFSWGIPEFRGLRVDPAYFYKLYPQVPVSTISHKVIEQAVAAGVNTLYLYAYAPTAGAFYQTDYPLADVEDGLGSLNTFKIIYDEAISRGLHVIAVIPLTDFFKVWTSKPSWRSKLRNGKDYKPFPQTYFMSAWHPEYRQWYRGFVKDLADRFPKLLAIEAVEPTVDCFWRAEADFNPIANQEFLKRFPKGNLGDANWKKMRAQGITELLAILAEEAHARSIKAGVVQTWPAYPSGKIFPNDAVRDAVGFDLNGILNLQEAQKIDLVVGEFLWQQWRAEYDTKVFSPSWTAHAAQDFIQLIKKRSYAIIHVEISPWKGARSTITPTLQEFQETMMVVKNIPAGIDVYDHSQIEERNAWENLREWVK